MQILAENITLLFHCFFFCIYIQSFTELRVCYFMNYNQNWKHRKKYKESGRNKENIGRNRQKCPVSSI